MRLLPRLAHVLFSFWIGAMAVVAFVVAPGVFRGLRDRLTDGESNRVAGDLMAPIFSAVDLFGIFAAVLFAVAAFRERMRAGAALVLAGLAAANHLVLAPAIAARAEGFESYHKASEVLWGVMLLAGIVLAILGPDRLKAKGSS